VEISAVYIEGIALPDEVNKALDSRTSVGMFGAGEMNKYLQFQTAQAIPEAAKNPGGGMAAIGAGMGVGLSMMKNISKAMNEGEDASKNAAPPTTPVPAPEICYKCGAVLPAGGKFCTNCGATVNVKIKCAKCGAENNPSAKFCKACGEKLVSETVVCKKCGTTVDGKARFCPECGAQI
jgi:membrane protease subunit (stomatin/prohibitin family)